MIASTTAKQLGAGILPRLSRILLVTDFSPQSEVAAPAARLLARVYEGSITAVHVILRDQELGPNEAVVGTAEQLTALAERQMVEFLAHTSLLDFGCGSVITGGPFAESLASVIEENQIEVVVLGTQGRSGVGKLLLGSVAQRVFQVAPCPVLTVSMKAQQPRDPDGMLKRILYATDMSEASLEALPYALSLAKASHAELLLVHTPETEDHSRDIGEDLSELIPAAARSWCRFEKLLTTGDPAKAIVTLSAESAADLIVIGTERVVEGPLYRVNVPLSTAYRIVAHARCPVLRVRT
jgi:nucleotide-binding universal stress UspA family protein